MSFRRRITISAAVAVAVAVVLASLLTYVLVRNQLRGSIDSSLRSRAGAFLRLAHSPSPPELGDRGIAALTAAADGTLPSAPRRERQAALLLGSPPSAVRGARGTAFVSGAPGGPRVIPGGLQRFYRAIPVQPGQAATFGQLVAPSGPALRLPSGGVTLPQTPAVRTIASRGTGSALFDATVAGQHLRVLTIGVGPGRAVELARSLGEVDSVLSNVRLILILLAAGGVALAAVLGRFVSGTVVAPVRRLTDAAEHVAQTRDLQRRIEPGRNDELGRLAVSFNAMLEALDHAARAQRQLVADASHELRTPVTSLRTNIEILQQSDTLPEPERERLIGDVVEQLEELSALIGDLIELARDDEQREAPEEVRLDQLVAEAVARTRLHAPEARFETALEETVVNGVPQRLDRAVNNLLENAVKFAGTAEPIEVRLRDGELTVRDHGPGIESDELPHVFDRFYRGEKVRALPGSGLGLAIVRQVAEAHGGTVGAESAVGGGTLVRLRLPPV